MDIGIDYSEQLIPQPVQDLPAGILPPPNLVLGNYEDALTQPMFVSGGQAGRVDYGGPIDNCCRIYSLEKLFVSQYSSSSSDSCLRSVASDSSSVSGTIILELKIPLNTGAIVCDSMKNSQLFKFCLNKTRCLKIAIFELNHQWVNLQID